MVLSLGVLPPTLAVALPLGLCCWRCELGATAAAHVYAELARAHTNRRAGGSRGDPVCMFGLLVWSSACLVLCQRYPRVATAGDLLEDLDADHFLLFATWPLLAAIFVLGTPRLWLLARVPPICVHAPAMIRGHVPRVTITMRRGAGVVAAVAFMPVVLPLTLLAHLLPRPAIDQSDEGLGF